MILDLMESTVRVSGATEDAAPEPGDRGGRAQLQLRGQRPAQGAETSTPHPAPAASQWRWIYERG